MIDWRGSWPLVNGGKGGEIDLPARLACVVRCGLVALEMPARECALSVCTRTSCLLPQRRGRCLLRLSDLLPLASFVRCCSCRICDSRSTALAPMADWRCRAARIVKRGDPNLSHARSRVWPEACRDMRAACQSNMYQETCRVEDRVWINQCSVVMNGGTEEALQVMYAIMH